MKPPLEKEGRCEKCKVPQAQLYIFYDGFFFCSYCFGLAMRKLEREWIKMG